MRIFFRQSLKYLTSGAIGGAVYGASFLALVMTGWSYTPSFALALVPTWYAKYLLYKHWAYKSDATASAPQLIPYTALAIAGFCVYTSNAYVLEFLAGYSVWYANAFAHCVTGIFRFFAFRWLFYR